MEKKQIAEVLTDLIATCQDAEEGFRAAAEVVKDGDLKTTFNRHSNERKAFANELDQVAQGIGQSASTSGSAHHAWTGIKSVATAGNPAAIVEEAGRGERYALGAYRRALDTDLPPDVRSIVVRQFDQVRATHDEMVAMEQRYARSYGG